MASRMPPTLQGPCTITRKAHQVDFLRIDTSLLIGRLPFSFAHTSRNRAAVSRAVDGVFRNSLAETLTETEQAFQLGFVAMSNQIIAAIRVVSRQPPAVNCRASAGVAAGVLLGLARAVGETMIVLMATATKMRNGWRVSTSGNITKAQAAVMNMPKPISTVSP